MLILHSELQFRQRAEASHVEWMFFYLSSWILLSGDLKGPWGPKEKRPVSHLRGRSSLEFDYMAQAGKM